MNRVIQIFFDDQPSAENKSAIRYFSQALPSTLGVGLQIEFSVAGKSELREYKKHGVTSFPTLKLNNHTVSGLNNIVEYINSTVTREIAKKKNKTSDDLVKEFMVDAIGNLEKDDNGKFKTADEGEDDDDMGERLASKAQSEMKRRNETAAKNKKHFGAKKSTSASSINVGRKKPPARRRNGATAPNHDPNASDVLKNMAKTSGNQDDLLMANFFANMQETVV
jgi:hypothetical protein